MREWFDYWWRFLKFTVLALAVPVGLYLLLVWLGVLQ